MPRPCSGWTLDVCEPSSGRVPTPLPSYAMHRTHPARFLATAFVVLTACGDHSDGSTQTDAADAVDTSDGSGTDAAVDAAADSASDTEADVAADSTDLGDDSPDVADDAPETTDDAAEDVIDDSQTADVADTDPDVPFDTSDVAPDTDTEGPGPSGPGETCEGAGSLADASDPIEPPGTYTHSLSAAVGTSNDYNPLDTSGLQPGCSIVYDSRGYDTVWAVTLEPGQTISMRVTGAPSSAIPSVYFLDSCPGATWPDNDGSTMCGNNEYRTEGFCGAVPFCDPLEWSYTWPAAVGGAPTSTKQLWLVVDEVAGTSMTDYTLEWAVTGP